MKIGKKVYVELPTPDNSKILGLPMAPADNMTSFPTLILCVCPSGVVNLMARALRSVEDDDEPVGRSQMMRVTVEFVRTLKFGRSI